MARIFPRKFIWKMMGKITMPLSQHIVKHAKSSPLLRQYVLLNLGKAYSKREEILRKYNWSTSTGTVTDVRAMELGMQMILDYIFMALLVASAYAEISKALISGEKRHENKDLKIEDLAFRREELMDRIKQQSEEIRKLKERMAKYTQDEDLPAAGALGATKHGTDEKPE